MYFALLLGCLLREPNRLDASETCKGTMGKVMLHTLACWFIVGRLSLYKGLFMRMCLWKARLLHLHRPRRFLGHQLLCNKARGNV